jgi:hypothetical protein
LSLDQRIADFPDNQQAKEVTAKYLPALRGR